MQYIVELVYTDRYFIHSLGGCVGSISRASLRLWIVFKSTDHCAMVSGTAYRTVITSKSFSPYPCAPSLLQTHRKESFNIDNIECLSS